MPILVTDIQVPAITRRDEHGATTSTCSLCGRIVGYDYNFQPELHRLDECLRELLPQPTKNERHGDN
jgi:hypothetical protein